MVVAYRDPSRFLVCVSQIAMPRFPGSRRAFRSRRALLAAGLTLVNGGSALAPVGWVQTADLIAFGGAAWAAPMRPARTAEGLCRGVPGLLAGWTGTDAPADTDGNEAAVRTGRQAGTEDDDGTAPLPLWADHAPEPAATDRPALATTSGRGERDGPRGPLASWPWAEGLPPSPRTDDATALDLPPTAFLLPSRFGPTTTTPRDDGAAGQSHAADSAGCGAAGCTDPALLVLPADTAGAAGAPAAAVPEPGGLALLGAAVTALAWVRRRRAAARR